MFLISASLLDIFQTLFHPAGRGALSDWTAKIVWRIFRSTAARLPRVLIYAGPFAILSIIVSWVGLIWIGFALIYLPRLGSGFIYSSPAHPNHHGITEALGVSIGALITLSEGSYAVPHWLQLVRAFEAVLGFGLLTASVSWLLSIYPVLETRRSVAQRATLLHHAERGNHIDIVRDTPEQARDLVFNLGTDLAGLRNQMAQFPITYYFDTGEAETAISSALSYLRELSDRSIRSSSPDLRLSGTMLRGSVDSLLEMLARDFLAISPDDKQAIMQVYAREQMSKLLPDQISSGEKNERMPL